MRLSYLLAVAWTFVMGALPARGEITLSSTVDETYGPVFTAIIGGTITPADRDRFLASEAEVARANLRMMILGSEGGDLQAAMDMGRFARSMEFTAILVPDAVCYSACVFLLAAGVDKRVQGYVGIHRPYFTASTADSPGDELKAVKADAEAYLSEMNIPVRLADDMFSIEPVDMRILSEDELRDYRLNSMDYVARETKSLERAEQYGLTREAYEAFTQDLNYRCQIFMGDSDKLWPCMNAVATQHGVTMPSGSGE